MAHFFKGVILLGLIGEVSLAFAAPAQDQSEAAYSTVHQVGQAVDRVAITAQVKTALLADGRTKAFDTRVDTSLAGVVTLTGPAPSAESKQAAGEVASHVAGVTEVINRLVVAPDRTAIQTPLSAQAEKLADNGWLTAKVKAALADDTRVSSLGIHVDSDHGVVTLTGTVPTEEARVAAMDRTWHVAGVSRVDAWGLRVTGP
jgi:osmotically-inducible protein OsmY